MKKIISVILAVLMLAVLAVPAFADDAIAIKTAEEFMAMESGKSYYLANDIDFGGKVFRAPALSLILTAKASPLKTSASRLRLPPRTLQCSSSLPQVQ